MRVAERLKSAYEGQSAEPLSALLIISNMTDWEFYFIPVGTKGMETYLFICFFYNGISFLNIKKKGQYLLLTLLWSLCLKPTCCAVVHKDYRSLFICVCLQIHEDFFPLIRTNYRYDISIVCEFDIAIVCVCDIAIVCEFP